MRSDEVVKIQKVVETLRNTTPDRSNQDEMTLRAIFADVLGDENNARSNGSGGVRWSRHHPDNSFVSG